MTLKKFSPPVGLKMALAVITIILAIVILAFTAFYFWGSSGALPHSRLSQIINYGRPHPQAPTGGQTFTIMTYNIGYLSGMTNNQPVKPPRTLFENNMTAFLQLLEKNPPDFIAFQEIDFHSRRSYYIDQLRTIAENAGYPHAARAVNWDKRYVPFPYGSPAVHFGKILSGQAILSRWPIRSSQRTVLRKPITKPFYYNAFYLDRLVQIAAIKIGSQDLVIINVHLEAFCTQTREQHAQTVLNIYRTYKDDHPVLLLGDFNSIPPGAPQENNFSDEPGTDFSGDRTIQLFLREKSLKSAFLHQPGCEQSTILTFPTRQPTRKLDYIFYNHRKIQPLSISIPPIDSSDHLPLVMRFTLENTGKHNI
jgi:endonuclease/exonuclease/phosphatase family metal-dependent hydrolase